MSEISLIAITISGTILIFGAVGFIAGFKLCDFIAALPARRRTRRVSFLLNKNITISYIGFKKIT